MIIRKFNIHKDKEYSMFLLQSRNMDPLLTNDLPQIGYLAFNKHSVIAMGFLRQIEGSYAMLDSYITNPDETSKIRDKALDLITKELIREAKIFNISKLLAFSSDDNTIKRAQKHGFGYLPHVFTILNLS